MPDSPAFLSLAESESVSIAENSKWSVRRRFENGTFKLSYPPYGYDYIGNGEWAINEEQAKWVRFIYSETLSGKGSDAIAAELMKLGAPTKKGGKWTPTSVRGILSNEKYTGDCIFQKTYTDEQFNRHRNCGEMDQFYMEEHHEAMPYIMPKTNSKKFRQKIRDIKVWLYANRDQPLKKLMGMLNLKLTGHYRYYGISFNGRMISNYKQQVRELLFKVLNRRSDRKSYTREGFIEMLKYYPLAMPKIYVSLF